MTGAVTVFAINIALCAILGIGFLAIGRFDRTNRAANWFALAYGVGLFAFVFEFLIALDVWVPFSRMGAALAILGAQLIVAYGVARRMHVEQGKAQLGAIALAASILYLLILDLPRDDLARQWLYQLPYILVAVLAMSIQLRASHRSGLDWVLFGLFGLSALNLISKPVVALHIGGVGEVAPQYAHTLYAVFSQGTGAVLALAVGVTCLLLVGRDSASTLLSATERDAQTGFLNQRGFDLAVADRLAALRAQDMAVLCLLELDPPDPAAPSRSLDHDIGRFVRIVESQHTAHVLAGRIAPTEFALFVPGTNLFTIRHTLEAMRQEFGAEGSGATLTVGITEREPGDAVADMMARARWALRQARQAGGNCLRLAARSGVGLMGYNRLG